MELVVTINTEPKVLGTKGSGSDKRGCHASQIRINTECVEFCSWLWKEVKGADGYEIFRYNKGNKFVKVAAVKQGVAMWKSGKTLYNQTFKIRAYKKRGKKRSYSILSYEVSAIPYKKKAKKVNAGRVKINIKQGYRVRLSVYESKKMTAKIKVSKFAGNKKAKIYDTAIRWCSSNEKVVKVDGEGNIKAQGKTGKCKIYARAHNGNCDWFWVEVINYARPEEFDGLKDMQMDMAILIQQHGSELRDIAEYFEKNKAIHYNESQAMLFQLDSERKCVEGEIINGEIETKGIEGKLYLVMEAYPGVMQIYVTNFGVHFILEGNNSAYVELVFLFEGRNEKENGMKESNDLFQTAPRWIYHYSRAGM